MTKPDSPFTLPVLFEERLDGPRGYGRISDAQGETISEGIRHDTAAYIIRSVNGYEKALADAISWQEDFIKENQRITPLMEKIEKLREALRPFAQDAARYEPDEGDSGQRLWGEITLTIGDLRRAAAVLKEIEDD